MFIFKYLLWPFAVLFDVITHIRNYLFDIGYKKSFEFKTVVISVGNLNVGGSGKTPMIEYLIRLLSQRFLVSTLSRGYGRRTKGLRMATIADSAQTIGDEPFQLYRKFGHQVNVVVGEERSMAIAAILKEFPKVKVILMDDAFQHRTVKPNFSILVTDFENPFYKDFLLPFGRLREGRTGARRADVIVVTKANGINEEKMGEMALDIKKAAGDRPVFFSGLKYHDPLPIHHEEKIDNRIILVSGIAKNSHFEKEVSNLYQVMRHYRFEDHHTYSVEDIKRIQQGAQEINIKSILTTEKDMVKLISPQLLPLLNKNWFYLPVQLNFIKDGMHFDEMIISMTEARIQQISSMKNAGPDRKSLNN